MTILSIALENAATSAFGLVVPEVSSGVSLSTGLMCANLVGAVDILVDVGGWVRGWAAEFSEMFKRVK